MLEKLVRVVTQTAGEGSPTVGCGGSSLHGARILQIWRMNQASEQPTVSEINPRTAFQKRVSPGLNTIDA